MILSPLVSPCVVAGAGSGTATTLIQRILILHTLLGISLDELHVFSCTKASTQEFQRKLERTLAFWEERVEGTMPTRERQQELQRQGERAVSTFHSVIARLCRAVLPGGSLVRAFCDLLGSGQSEEERVQGVSNPFENSTIAPEHTAMLNAAHTAA